MNKLTGVIINSDGDMIATIHGNHITHAMKQNAVCTWEVTRDMTGKVLPVNAKRYRITTAKHYLESAARRDDLPFATCHRGFWVFSE